MKKILKFIKHNVLGFIVGAVIFGSFGVYAATVIAASNVGYSDNNDLGAVNVQDAIDKLNTKVATKIKEAEAKCPEGKVCKDAVCKRATTLHTEICSNDDSSYYCQADGYKLNDTITYGNLGTKGILTSGDAFDCDVNGDGIYDSETERFYYVSDMTNGVTQDSNTAVLIYYNNVSGGVASNLTSYAYDVNGDAYINGPATAKEQLPTIKQWKNISLTNMTRDITDDKETVRKLGFNYETYAGRLLTYQEVYSGCFDETTSIVSIKGLSTKCKYLMENTKYSSINLTYGEWLESPETLSSRYAWFVRAYYRSINSNYDGDPSTLGVRPAIEVLKSNISY